MLIISCIEITFSLFEDQIFSSNFRDQNMLSLGIADFARIPFIVIISSLNKVNWLV